MGCINLGSFKVVGLWLTTTQHVVQSPPLSLQHGEAKDRRAVAVCSWEKEEKF